MTSTIPKTSEARKVCKQIEEQFPRFPEARLMYSIVERAILDLTENRAYTGAGESADRVRWSAGKYLMQPQIYQAEVCGVESGWIRKLLYQSGILARPEQHKVKKLGYSRLNSRYQETRACSGR